MDQAPAQSVDSAVERMLDGGLIDSILGTDEQDTQEPESQEQEIEETADDTETVATEEESEESDEGETEEVAEDDSETAESDNAESDEEQIEIDSIDSLTEALGVPKEELLDNLTIDVVIDGETQSVSLREAQAGYQKDADYRRKTGELAQQRRELESKHQESQQHIEYQHQIAANVFMAAQRQLIGEANSERMAQLRQTDPVQWTAERADLIERTEQFKALEQQAQQAYYQNKQLLEQQTAQTQQERLSQEAEALQKLVPNFREIKPDLDNYLAKDYGFSNEDLTQVADHRLVDLARKAMLYDKSQAKVQQLKPKIKKAPKTQKPAPKASKPGRSDKLKVAKSKLRKSGDVRDAASAIENFL